jgi:hypothetical protein
MRVGVLLIIALLVASPADLQGQWVMPVAVRANHNAVDRPLTGTSWQEKRGFRGKRVLIGAGIGAAIGGTLGAFMATGICDQADCSDQWPAGFATGAVIGGLIGGFGLIVALPWRH